MPKITDIQTQKRNKARSSLYIDGIFFVGASNYVIRRNKLEIGKEVDKERLEVIIKEDSIEKAKGYIVDYHLNKTIKIIQDKLKEKGYGDEVVLAVMDFIDKYKLVDDQEYAKRKTSTVLNSGKKGSLVIAQTLKQKGVSEQNIQQALETITIEEQIEVAKEVLESKITGFRRKAKNKYDFRSKCYYFLMRRGFTGDIITKALEDKNWEGESEDEA